MANINIIKEKVREGRIPPAHRDVGYLPGGYYRLALSGVVAGALPSFIPIWTDPATSDVYGVPTSVLSMAVFSVEGGSIRWRDDFIPMSASPTITTLITDNPLAVGAATINVTAATGALFAADETLVIVDGANTETVNIHSILADALTIHTATLAAHAQGTVIAKLVQTTAGTSPITPLQLTTQLSASNGGVLQASGDIVTYVGSLETLRFILASGAPVIHFNLYR